MSGGIDSSVTAALLEKAHYQVIGLFMNNWDEKNERGICRSSQDYADVQKVCHKINIPYYHVEFIKEYKEHVFKSFIENYKQGYTPNPDVLCNREIKFKLFYEKAKALGADYIATGHYCQISTKNKQHSLLKARDPKKDQSYFLYTLKSNLLKKVLFPIGHLYKKEVKELAKKWDLPIQNKKESMGICFIGKRNFKNFLAQYIPKKRGFFKTLDGKIVGEHQGTSFYTLGQRKGLGIGEPGPPWYIVEKDMLTNTLFVERGDKHPALYRKTLIAFEISWVDPDFTIDTSLSCMAKIRYGQNDQECIVTNIDNDKLSVQFKEEQKAMALRQSIVFYKKIDEQDICLGGGSIESFGPHLMERQSKKDSVI